MDLKIFYSDNQEVALVYYRAGYAPAHFKSQVVNWTNFYYIKSNLKLFSTKY